jgi:hypothetical protein
MIENFIVTGCSFTSGVFEFDYNSEDPQSIWEQTSCSWPHFVFGRLGVKNKKFFNFAIPGGGNTAAMTNLVLFLEKNPNYNNSNTLVGINLTELGRSDFITNKNDANANNDRSTQHIKENLNIGWITKGIDGYKSNLELHNAVNIIQTLTYLKSKNINYFFMLMTDEIYHKSPQFFKKFLDTESDNWITFDKTLSMKTFVVDKKLTESNTNFHPKLG